MAKTPRASSPTERKTGGDSATANKPPAKRQKTAPAPATVPLPPTPVSSSTVAAPAASLPAPTYNPGACFTQALPAPITPWPHCFPAPTPRFDRPLPSCPVNWSAISGLTAEHIEAYELRAPWNPNQGTFSTVRKTSQHSTQGRVPSEEGVRKRFRKACLAVFKCSGVYFEESALGLEAYGVPVQKKLRDILDEMRTPTLPTPAPTPAPAHSGSADESATAHKFTPIARGNSEAFIYTGEIVAFQLQTAEDDRPNLRVCDKRLILNNRILLDYDVTVTQNGDILIESQVPTLPFSTQAFDRWHSSVCFGNRHKFPERDYICREIEDGQYLLRDNGKPSKEFTTLGLMLESYAVSQAMGTRTASKMMLNEIVRRLGGGAASMLGMDEEALLRHLAVDDPLLDAIADFRHPVEEQEEEKEEKEEKKDDGMDVDEHL